MKTKLFLILFVIAFCCNYIVAQEEKTEKAPMKMNIKGGIGSSNLYLGLAGGLNLNLGVSAELPMTKSGKWNTNLGLRISNDHIFDYYGINSSDFNFTSLRLDIPIIFSYDLNIYNNSANQRYRRIHHPIRQMADISRRITKIFIFCLSFLRKASKSDK